MRLPFKNLMSGANSDAVLAAMNKSLAMIEFDPAGNILGANGNFLAAMGYEAKELAGQHHRMFVDPAYARSAEYTAFWERLGKGTFDAGEYKRFGKGGREVWIQATYNPVLSASGKVLKVVKFATDIRPSRPQAAILAKSENVLGTWHSVLTMEIIEEDSSLHHREWVDGSEYSGRGFDRTMEPELCRY